MVVAAYGLDLSLAKSGIAGVIPATELKPAFHYVGRVGQDGITNLAIVQQMTAIGLLVDQIADRVLDYGRPEVVVMEALDQSHGYGGTIERTVLWWKVAEAIDARGATVYIPTSSQVKLFATGNGRANKGEVMDAVTRLWPEFDHRGDDNKSDAAAMAMMGVYLLARWVPLLPPLPKKQTDVLTRVRRLTDPPPAANRKRKTT